MQEEQSSVGIRLSCSHGSSVFTFTQIFVLNALLKCLCLYQAMLQIITG